MVYNLTSNLYAVLGQIAHIEATTRTDGKTPLLDRVCEVIFNLDKQPNKTSVILPSIPTRVFYVTIEYYTIYYFHNGVDACIIQIDTKKSTYNLRPNQTITTSVDYASLVSQYKPYMTSHYNYRPYVFVKHKGRNGKFNLMKYNGGRQEIMFDIDFDEIIPFNQYDDGYYGKGYLYGDKGWYKLFTNRNYEYHDETENNDLREGKCHQRIILKESQLRGIIRESIKRILNIA